MGWCSTRLRSVSGSMPERAHPALSDPLRLALRHAAVPSPPLGCTNPIAMTSRRPHHQGWDGSEAVAETIPSWRRDVIPGVPWWRHAVVQQIVSWSSLDATASGMADLQEIIIAHDMGLAVVIDQVWNPASQCHSCFVESCKSRHELALHLRRLRLDRRDPRCPCSGPPLARIPDR